MTDPNPGTEPEPNPDPDVDEFAAAQRRRTWISVGATALVVGVIAAVVMVKQANKLPGLDPDEVRNIREALDTIPPEYRQPLAARAFADLEVGRIPVELREGFEGISNAPPGMGDLLLLAAFADDEPTRATWLLACPNGLNILAEGAAVADATQHVYAKCELGRLGLLGDSELGGVSLGELVATHAAWAHLVEHDSETDIERRLLRTIMGRS